MSSYSLSTLVARRGPLAVVAVPWIPFVARRFLPTGNDYPADVLAGLAITLVGFAVGAVVLIPIQEP